jgi:hypothetical protein
MHLTRCQDQKSKTLDEFYTEISQSTERCSKAHGLAMLDLITRLRALRNEHKVYGLTSHHRLCLLAEDAHSSPWYVIVTPYDHTLYLVEYRLPPLLAPWPHAYVRGEAKSVDEAVSMILTAMAKSEGWVI